MIEAQVRRQLDAVEVEPAPPMPPETPDSSPDQQETWRSALLSGLAVFLASSSAAWMSAGVFRGVFPRVVGVLGTLLGVGLVTYSLRTRRPSIIQYLVLPAAIVAGALLVALDPAGAGANIPEAVTEAIRAGGIAQPPIAFDPGWKFILFVLSAALGAAAASTAAWLGRPKLGVFIPLPLLFATALIQPRETALLSSIVALVLLVGALTVSYGVELIREGASSGGFEVRRYARGAVAMAVLVVLVIIVSRAGFLFPDIQRRQVIPPKKPEVQARQADRVLFTVESQRAGPWRLGVLDVYQEDGWLLPPFDLGRLQDVPRSGEIPEHPAAPADPGATESTKFIISELTSNQVPSVAGAVEVDRSRFQVQFDPRTQTFRLPEGRAAQGLEYTVESAEPPTGEDLAQAPPPPPEMNEYLNAPIAPNEVVALLAEAPATNAWDRLQFVRNAFFQNVVASGAGHPVDLPASRVAEMLQGREATPYEITAAEALLARWAGIPSRIGYGFYKGDKDVPTSSSWEVHPRHGSSWLEAYFHGHGWVPIVGTPPRAKASLSDEERQRDPSVRPSEELALVVYVPVKLETIRLVYIAVRYWFLVALPFVIGLALIGGFYPWALKSIRRYRRRRWAAKGMRERIAVAYSNLRDAANDLNIGDPVATPLMFVESLAEDAEHTELAWLVTRTLWGDLSRDLRVEDVEAAEDMAQSVTRRLRRAQPSLTRILSLGSRSSLRNPHSHEIPNMWPRWADTGLIRPILSRPLHAVLRALRRVRRLLPVGSLIAMLIFTACAPQTIQNPAAGGTAIPETIAPEEFQGFTFQREASAEESFDKVTAEDSLVTQGYVYTVRKEGEVLASLQVAQFKPGFGAGRREVRQGVLDSIGTGTFNLTRIGGERMYVKEQAEQNFYLWFAPTGRYYQLLVARKGFAEAGRVFSSLLRNQRGEGEVGFSGEPVEELDPRRGEEG